MKSPISQRRARNNGKAFNDYFIANNPDLFTQYENEEDETELSIFCEHNQFAYERGQAAFEKEKNPFKPNTAKWYSFNKGKNTNEY